MIRIIHMQATFVDEPNEMEVDLWRIQFTFEYLGLDHDYEFSISQDVIEDRSLLHVCKRKAREWVEKHPDSLLGGY